MAKNSASKMAIVVLGLSLLVAGPALAKGKGGGSTLSGCEARLLISAGTVHVLAQTADRKVDRVDIYQIERIVLPNGGSEEELIFLASAQVLRQPDGLYGALVALAVEAGADYEAQFVQESRRGDRVRCISEFSAPDPGGSTGGSGQLP